MTPHPAVRIRANLRGLARPPVILAYHGIADVPLQADYFRLFVSPGAVATQIRLFRRLGYTFVTFAEMIRRVGNGDADGFIALTFDDGFADNLSGLVPVIQKWSVPATTFVATGLLGKRHPSTPYGRIFSVKELRRYRESGGTVGSHGVAHRDLTTLSSDEARREIFESKATLEEILDEAIDVCAYPFGRFDNVTRALVREAGYIGACAVTEGSWADCWSVPRIPVVNGGSAAGLWLSSHPGFASIAGRPIRAGGRLVRRVQGQHD